MNPFQHGEVFVTDDGAETDLDLGHYERFTDARLSRASNFTTGQVYDTRHRQGAPGDFLGETVQVIPHITDEIKDRIRAGRQGQPDVVIVEIGGTVGDIESLPFLEAIRQMRHEWRQGARALRAPDPGAVHRGPRASSRPSPPSIPSRSSLASASSRTYRLPHRARLPPRHQGQDRPLLQRGGGGGDRRTATWTRSTRCRCGCASRASTSCCAAGWGCAPTPATSAPGSGWSTPCARPRSVVPIGVVGKYTEVRDAYKSITEALAHGGIANGRAHGDRLGRVRHLEGGAPPRARAPVAEEVRRHPGARRLRAARHRGQGQGDPLRPRAPDPLSGPVPGHAGRGHRVCPPRARAARRPTARSSTRPPPIR